MQRLLSLVTSDPKQFKSHGGDTNVDRMSCVVTFYVLVGFAGVVQFTMLAKDPVHCWVPAHFTGPHAEYTNSLCWMSDTYRLSFDQRIPKEGDPGEADRDFVSYYQWVGLMLALQGLLFRLPRLIWTTLSKRSGLSVATMTDVAMDVMEKKSTEDRETALKYMAQHMGRYLFKLNHRHGCWAAVRGHYLIVAYIFVKIVYLVNVIGQLFLLNKFLGTNYSAYGIEVLKNMANDESWLNSETFPKVTICDFKIRVLGNVQRYTVQCAMRLNLFNEAIFILVWFLFFFVAMITAASLLLSLIFAFSSGIRRHYITKRLVSMDKIASKNRSQEVQRDVCKFVSNFLRGDGVFIIKLVSKNSTDLITAELIGRLWDQYISEREQRLLYNFKRRAGKLHFAAPRSPKVGSAPENSELLGRVRADLGELPGGNI